MSTKHPDTIGRVMLTGFVGMLGLTVVSAMLLTMPRAAADATTSANALVRVVAACTMQKETTEQYTGEHQATLLNGTYTTDIGVTKLTTICNDHSGFAIYAIGFSNNAEGNTNMVGSTSGLLIPTGTGTGNESNWSMKISKDTTSYAPNNLTIRNGYGDYHVVPDDYQQIVSYSTNTGATQGSSILSTYAVRLSTTQAADTYLGKVKYVMVHPNYAAAPLIGINTIEDLEYMQDFATLTSRERALVLNSMEPGTNYALKDSRDGANATAKYNIAKLADGRVWMTTNLDLAGGTTLTSNDTDIPANYTLPTSAGFQEGNKLPAATTGGFSSSTTAYVANSGNTNESNCSQGCYSYYSWTAATVGSGLEISTIDEDAPYSICPKGWKLPTSKINNPSNVNSDYYRLASSYGLGTLSNSAFYNAVGPSSETPHLIAAGLYHSGGFGYSENSVYYWTATGNGNYGPSAILANYLSISQSSNPSIAAVTPRFFGYPIRCILAEGNSLSINDLEYMQDFAAISDADKQSVITSMTPDTNYLLKDRRDGANATARYTIAKLTGTANNGYSQVWMTTNLDLAGGTQLTHEDTDIPANYTISTTGFTNNSLPASSIDFAGSQAARLYNSENTVCGEGNPCYSYYSWLAATAGGKDEDGNEIADYHNAPYSICPAGWRLPTVSTSGDEIEKNYNWTTGDFYALATAYGANLEDEIDDDSSVFFTNAGPGTNIPNFLLGGYILRNRFVIGYEGSPAGFYWSATSNQDASASARYLMFDSSYMGLGDYSSYNFGRSVRCILR